MKIEFSPDVISLLEKAKFYKSQTITKINPDNYGFKNEYHTWFGRPDTNHKDRPIMLSEADAKYVWKNSIFRSNTLSIIPWANTEKSGIWQIEVSQEILTKYIDNYIKNIKVDNKSIIYNSNNELCVSFDNDSIYEENGVWKAKQGGDTPTENNWEVVDTSDFVSNSSDVYRIKDYDSNNYIYNISISDQENNAINLNFTTFKNHPVYEFFVPSIIILRPNGLIEANKKLMFIHVERKKVI
ncbi:MAG: hypothetical protein EHV01_001905 [Spiroplasma sp. hy2]|uniref:hypothetical protein n=2 Tax=Spiroplasma sp. hy2 TaxID=2490850 RepID=UPI00383E8BD7